MGEGYKDSTILQIDFHLILYLPPVCLVPWVESLFSSISLDNKFPVLGLGDEGGKIEIQLPCVHFKLSSSFSLEA